MQRTTLSLSADEPRFPCGVLFSNEALATGFGFLVDNFGPQDADGFLHMFEGWIIFIACAALLVAEMHLLSRLTTGKGFYQVFYPPKVEAVRPAEKIDS